MDLTRRQVVGVAAAAALDLAGLYRLVDRFAAPPPARAAHARPPEQHLLPGVRIVREEGVEILVLPLHHEVLTAVVRVGRRDLRDARTAFEQVLAGLERDYAPTPAGLGITVAWGLPYFHRLLPDAARKHLPFDRRAGKAALLETRRFPSDPAATVLERNDVAVLLRSDVRPHIDDAVARLRATGLFRVTSRRRGFVGGARKMAVAAGIPGARLIPPRAELFLGFVSTQRAAMGPGKIANFETLGHVDLRPGAYFREGTHMHLSHLYEDVEAWYRKFDYAHRVTATFQPNLTISPPSLVARQGPEDVMSLADVRFQHKVTGQIGHSSSIQPTSRLQAAHRGPDGTRYPRGAAIPIRADFNTFDNPFFTSARPGEVKRGPSAGLHFVVFNPSSDDFARNRLAMDGVYRNELLKVPPRSPHQGMNSVLRTTHRQNFIVPPRRHRSFPLAEL